MLIADALKAIHRPKRWRVPAVRLLLVVALAAMAMIPLAVFAVWSSSAAFRLQLDDVRDRHLLIARNLGAALTRYHQDVLATFDDLSQSAVLGNPITPSSAMLESLGFRHICIVEVASGRVVEVLSPAPGRFPEVIDPERLGVYVDAATTGTTTVTGVMRSPDGSPTIYLLRRFGDLLSVGAIGTGYFHELGSAIAFGHAGHAAILDQNGRVLWHPIPGWVTGMRDLSSVEPVARMMAGETGVLQFHSPAKNAEMIAGYASVGTTGWGVMIPQPVAELRDAANAANNSALVVLAAGLLAAVAVGVALASRFTAPLRTVAAAARSMADGNRKARAEIRHGPLVPQEFRDLEEAFNAMAVAVDEAAEVERGKRERADAASRTKSLFLASVSHELRTPLTAISGFAQIIAGQMLGPLRPLKYQEYAVDIQESARRLVRLIDDLLDLTRVEFGHVQIEERAASVDDLLERVAGNVRGEADAKTIRLTVCNDFHLPIWVDPDRLAQILVNLCGNAVRYSPPGADVTLRAERLSDGRIEFTVTDTGPGISDTDMIRVMEPFQQGSAAVKRRGSGLGLAIVRNVATALGAEFHLARRPEGGTRASIRLHARVAMEAGHLGSSA